MKIKTFSYWVTSVDGKVAIISFVSWHSQCLHSPCNREFVSARGMVTSLRKTHDNTQHRLFPHLTHSISFLTTEPLILKCVESVSCATLNWWYEETTERSEFFWDHLIKDWVSFFSHLTDRIQPNRLISLSCSISRCFVTKKSRISPRSWRVSESSQSLPFLPIGGPRRSRNQNRSMLYKKKVGEILLQSMVMKNSRFPHIKKRAWWRYT